MTFQLFTVRLFPPYGNIQDLFMIIIPEKRKPRAWNWNNLGTESFFEMFNSLKFSVMGHDFVEFSQLT